MRKKQTIEEYLNQTNLVQSTIENYLYTIEHFLKMNPKAKRYKYLDLVNWLADTRSRYPNVQTTIRILSAVKKYYEYLEWSEQRKDNPCQTLTVKRGGNHYIQLQDLFTSSELELLLKRQNRYAHLLDRNKVLISLMIYQGLTVEEVRRLDVGDIDLSGLITIKRRRKRPERILNLKPSQILMFQSYLKSRAKLLKGNSTKFILTKLGKPISVSGINSVFDQLALLFPDRNLNPRTVRMSVISNWVNERKVPIETVQEWAGHEWPSSTEKYRRSNDGERRKLINQFFPF